MSTVSWQPRPGRHSRAQPPHSEFLLARGTFAATNNQETNAVTRQECRYIIHCCVSTNVCRWVCVRVSAISRLRPDSRPSQPANRLVYLGALVTELAGSCCGSCSCEAAPGDSWLFTPHPAPPSCRRWYLCSALCKPSAAPHHHHQLAVYLKTLNIFISRIYKDVPLGDVVDNVVFS